MGASNAHVCEIAETIAGGEWLTAGFAGVACISIGWLLSFVTREVITSRRGDEDRK